MSSVINSDVLYYSIMPMASKIYRIITVAQSGGEAVEMPSIKDTFLKELASLKEELVVVGYDDEFIKEVMYPIVATIDEVMLKTSVSYKWASETLQIQFYGDNMAGQNFYRKMKEFLSSKTVVFPIIEQYLFAMIYGFKGIYQTDENDERKKLISKCALILDENVYSNINFSPQEERKRLQVGWNPKYQPALLSSIAFGLILFWWIILFVISRTAI